MHAVRAMIYEVALDRLYRQAWHLKTEQEVSQLCIVAICIAAFD